jgi:hypothetical protein
MSTTTTPKSPIRVQLGRRPGLLAHTVQATLVDGSPALMDVQYVYRTRREFGELLDQLVKVPEKAPAAPVDAPADGRLVDAPAPQAPAPTLFGREMQQAQIEATADYLMAILHSWGLDVPLSREAAEQLCDEQPGVARAVIGDYHAAITEGRLGN